VLVVNMEQSGMDKERVVGPVREVVGDTSYSQKCNFEVSL
jgi:hypothetical protein